MHITVVIHTLNEEKNIVDAINSARLLTDRIIVVDMQSTDKTKILVEKMGIPFYSFPPSLYVEPARAFGIEKATDGWVFILDADERITKESAVEIKRRIGHESFTHYKIPRMNIFGKAKWLKHGGWWPDYQIRLIELKSFRSWPKQIHSTPQILGPIGFLEEPLTHYFHGNLETMVEKTVKFEDIESDLLYKAGRPVTTLTFFRKFAGELFRRLIKDAGFLDGIVGIIEGIYQAYSKTITYLYLYEKKKSRPI